eukprot:6014269-Alexandrium_andersonii.AAC.1
MSASLVGSEMCIRDSAKSGSSVRTRNCAGPRVASTLVPEAPDRVHPTPVSYTHLTLPTICSV